MSFVVCPTAKQPAHFRASWGEGSPSEGSKTQIGFVVRLSRLSAINYRGIRPGWRSGSMDVYSDGSEKLATNALRLSGLLQVTPRPLPSYSCDSA